MSLPAVVREPGRRHEVDLPSAIVPYRAYGPVGDPEIVLVHGLRGDHHGLEPIVAHLADRRVIVPDLPGFGEAPPLRRGEHDIDGYARVVTEMVDALAPGGVLLGHSFGSIIAAAAVAGGLDVRGLALVNPIAESGMVGPRRVVTGFTVGLHRLAAAVPERLGDGVLRSRVFTRVASVAMVKTRDRALRRWIHAEHDRWFGGYHDRRVLLEAFTASVTRGVTESAARIAVPTLLVGAELDDITAPRQLHELVALFPDARLELIPGTGHLAHYETPHLVAQHVEAFVAGLPGAALPGGPR